MERDKYRTLHKKIRKIESKLIPILSTPLNPEITPSQQPVLQTFHRNLHFMNNLLSAEMASSTEPQHLAHFVKRVIRLQRAVHSWTEGRTLTPYVESSGSDPGSFIESCVTDDDVGCDYKGEVSGLAGFTVYENPLFDGIVDSDDGYDDDADNDDSDDDADNENDNVGIIDEYEVEETEGVKDEDLIRAIDQGEEHESDAGNEGVEKEVIKVDYQKEDGKEQEKEEDEDDEDEDEEDEGGTQNCCYKILFWSLIIVMAVIFVMMILSNFPDNHALVMLTPT